MNKWDLVEPSPGAMKKLREETDHWLPQVKGVPVVAVSGLDRRGARPADAGRRRQSMRCGTSAWERARSTAGSPRSLPPIRRRRCRAGASGSTTSPSRRAGRRASCCSRAAPMPCRTPTGAISSTACAKASICRHADPADVAGKEESLCEAEVDKLIEKRMTRQADRHDRNTSRRAPRRAAFIFVFITVLLDMLALGIIIPVLPKLVVDFLAGDTARAAEIYGIFGTAWALMQFLFSPLHGALSDRFGRRPVILHLQFRARARLYPDGAGAESVVAVRGSRRSPASARRASRPPTPISPT